MTEDKIDRIDKTKVHGTIYGDPNIGYFQDGKHYRHDGTVYEAPVKAESPPLLHKPAERTTLHLKPKDESQS